MCLAPIVMHGRSGRPSRGPPPGLDPQVGFQVLPPDGGHGGHKSSKKKSRDHSRRGGGGAAGQSRRWASQNQLDVITEASDESRYIVTKEVFSIDATYYFRFKPCQKCF